MWLVDALLALGILILGWRVTAAAGALQAVVLFIVFGALMALAWVRMGAVDVALAEAAVGAGITGVLLLLACRDLVMPARQDAELGADRPRWGLALLVAAIVAPIALAVGRVTQRTTPMSEAVQAHLGQSGVSNPVTAVLLNFRAYDTLFEVAVLLTALLAVATLAPGRGAGAPAPAPVDATGLSDALARVLTLTGAVVGGYLLWRGADAPGGAFQGGAVIAAAGILLALSGHIEPAAARRRWSLHVGAAGLSVFVIIGLATLPLTGGLLTYPVGTAKWLILVIEAAVTVSVALTLLLLALGVADVRRRHP